MALRFERNPRDIIALAVPEPMLGGLDQEFADALQYATVRRLDSSPGTLPWNGQRCVAMAHRLKPPEMADSSIDILDGSNGHAWFRCAAGPFV